MYVKWSMFLTTNILCSGGVLVSCVYARLSVGVFNVNIINAWVYVYVYVIKGNNFETVLSRFANKYTQVILV